MIDSHLLDNDDDDNDDNDDDDKADVSNLRSPHWPSLTTRSIKSDQ